MFSYISSFIFSLLKYLLYSTAIYASVRLVIMSGLLDRFEWYQKLQSKLSISNIIFKQLMNMLINKANSKTREERNVQQAFTIDSENNRSHTNIEYNGNSYAMVHPFSRTHSLRLSNVIVYLDLDNNKVLDITHPPGVPYPYTPKELGGIGYDIIYKNMCIYKIPLDEKLELAKIIDCINKKLFDS